MAATKTPGSVTAPYTLSWIVLGFLNVCRGAAPDRRRRRSTTGVRLSVCDSGWRSSFVGVGLSIEELSKDCVQRGALEAVVRRRPDIFVVASTSTGGFHAGLGGFVRRGAHRLLSAVERGGGAGSGARTASAAVVQRCRSLHEELQSSRHIGLAWIGCAVKISRQKTRGASGCKTLARGTGDPATSLSLSKGQTLARTDQPRAARLAAPVRVRRLKRRRVGVAVCYFRNIKKPRLSPSPRGRPALGISNTAGRGRAGPKAALALMTVTLLPKP